MACGAGAYSMAMFHRVTTHAFFKALFVSRCWVGDYAMSDEQDMRKMGGMWSRIP